MLTALRHMSEHLHRVRLIKQFQLLTRASVIFLISASSTAYAGNRLALVIGNDAYEQVASLDRAVADSRAYRKLLEEDRGFTVFYAENSGRGEMNARVAEFLSAIRPGDITMVVYSGHGVQLETERRDSLYLLPVDFPNQDPGRGAERHFFDAESINFARLAENVASRGAGLRIFVLDACRNNPFKREGGTRAIGMTRGLGRIQSTSGEFVIYAAAPGEVAFDSLPGEDSDSVNSVFSRAFIRHFREGTYLEDVANDVQDEVVRLTRAANVEQEPYYSDGVAGRTCLEESCGKQISAPTSAKADVERETLYWEFCESKNEPAYCRAYLEAFPDGDFAPLARARLIEMTGLRSAPVSSAFAATENRSSSPTETDVTPDTRLQKSDDARQQTDRGNNKVTAVDPAEAQKQMRNLFQPTPKEVRDMQARLTILGHKPGPIDGVLGKRTSRAISAFQRAASILADGQVTQELLARLRATVSQGKLDRFYTERAEARAAAKRAALRRAARERALQEQSVQEEQPAIKTVPLQPEAPSSTEKTTTATSPSGVLRSRNGNPITLRSNGKAITTGTSGND